jgi:hypothetical protein
MDLFRIVDFKHSRIYRGQGQESRRGSGIFQLEVIRKVMDVLIFKTSWELAPPVPMRHLRE